MNEDQLRSIEESLRSLAQDSREFKVAMWGDKDRGIIGFLERQRKIENRLTKLEMAGLVLLTTVSVLIGDKFGVFDAFLHLFVVVV